MFSKELEKTLNSAFEEARKNRHEYLTVEHLFLALLNNPEAIEVLNACNVASEKLALLKEKTAKFIATQVHTLAHDSTQDLTPTIGFQRVLHRAMCQVQASGGGEVTGANVLAAIFGEKESQAVFYLNDMSVHRLDVMNYIAHGISKLQPSPRIGGHIEQPYELEIPQESQYQESLLDRYTINYNELAKRGKFDPLIGREHTINRVIQVLSRRRKNNPLFVGDAGVGKTAIVEGLAQLIVNNKVPESIAKATIYALDLGVLLAGTKYRGDFEKRFKAVLKELNNVPDAIIFIDEIHTIIGAGAASGGTMDASNLLKPLLSGGELRCMGSTTYQEYRSIFEKDRALTRRFQKIDIQEPNLKETVEILFGLKSRLEEFHGVKYTKSALKLAAELAERYISDRQLPDKAIDVIDEAGAYQKLQTPSKRKQLIGKHEIEEVVAKMARIPSRNLTMSDKEALQTIERDLKMIVFGQDQAIETLSTAIKLARSGLRDAEKPVGSFLFSGPTGVGKTEVTRQLAKTLNVELIRFDMSEYMERHSVSRLIGSPPGYVGYEEGGLLTEAVNKHPHAVLLLDEIEKAHMDVYNLLLQVMDHGKLTDNNGRTTDFRHVILVMTTNAGAEALEKSQLGFANHDDSKDSFEFVRRMFSPEFRNRLDAIIQFKHLDQSVIQRVVDKFLTELEAQLSNRGVMLEVDQSVKDWLCIKGYDRKMGARPMSRLIQESIKKPLADELIFGALSNGGKVKLKFINNKIELEVELSKVTT